MTHAALLVDVWREICRHVHIDESVRFVFDRVLAEVPARALVVRRWDTERARLQTVAHVGALADRELPLRTPTPTPLRAALDAWASRGATTAFFSRDETSLSRLLAPEGWEGPLSVGPLHAEGRLLGVVLVGGDLRAHHDLLDALREPLAVALANDERLHELERLREAADADRQALLTRLGRQDVGDVVVGADAGLREVMQRVAQVAPTDAPVLLRGETGSGKEVVARAIHRTSRRAAGPFLRVNCGALPPELVDSELFGHERGAFTGAVAARKGWFERADGGTLFLDEIGELPPAAQVRLLRVLQDGTYQRVGGQHTLHCDVRIVAATHRDLPELVRAGRFREDLWYRISVFPITLPPLRARPGDVRALAFHFAERAGLRLRGAPLVPTEGDVARLVAYDWPGNVRELAAVIERAAILGDGGHLAVGPALGEATPPGPALRADGTPAGDATATLLATLERCRGRIEGPFGAAEALGVNPHTLRARMRRLGVDWSVYRGRRATA